MFCSAAYEGYKATPIHCPSDSIQFRRSRLPLLPQKDFQDSSWAGMGVRNLVIILIIGVLSVYGESAAEGYGSGINGRYSRNWTEPQSIIPYDPRYADQRNSKFFPLFTIIRFTNEQCLTTSEENGVCYTRKQCTTLGGIPAGSCAQSLGVCCQFFVTCGAIVNQNQTQFRNPEYPNKYRPASGSDVCQVRVRKQVNVCQLRLNFVRFDVDGPTPGLTLGAIANDAGTCKTDALSITSSGAIVPPVCGNMNGQHMYLDYGTSDTVTLNLLLSQNANRDREWNIEIQMIPCRSELRAPTGCLQYFQGVSGQVTSFNFPGQIHLANMDYSACVRMEDGMRSIEWSACNVGEVDIAGPTPIPATQATPIPACTNVHDYLTIMGGVAYPLSTTAVTAAPGVCNIGESCMDRFCDIHFGYANSLVRSSVRPFILHFRTDGSELPIVAGAAAAEASIGFCLKWQQSPSG